jgi:hypothetical protein
MPKKVKETILNSAAVALGTALGTLAAKTGLAPKKVVKRKAAARRSAPAAKVKRTAAKPKAHA